MRVSSLAWPDRFFPFLFVVAETTNKNGKKRSGHARLARVLILGMTFNDVTNRNVLKLLQ